MRRVCLDTKELGDHNTVDAVFARARYSREINGVEPQINADGQIHIKQGRHPVKGHVVPIDVWLGDDFHILVITGP